MPSNRVRFIFTVTSMAPIFFTYAMMFFFDGGFKFSLNADNIKGIVCLIAMILLVWSCLRILRFFSTKVSSGPMTVTSLRVADRSAVTFVVVYLVPLVTTENIGVRPIILLIVLGFLAWLIYHSDAYLVNPLLAMWPFKYHFYEITTSKEIVYILVSQREILNTKDIKEVKQISRYMFLDVEGRGD